MNWLYFLPYQTILHHGSLSTEPHRGVWLAMEELFELLSSRSFPGSSLRACLITPKLPRNFSDRRLIVDIDLFPPHTTFILPKSLVTLHFGQ